MIYEKPKNEIFASDAKDGEIVDFPNVKRGWGVTENLGFIPPMEYFNAAFNRVDKSIAYQLQRGVAEWDKDLEYPIGAVVSLNGVVYVAKSQNTNKNPANEATIWDIVATQKWCEDSFMKKTDKIDAYTKQESDKKFALKDDLPPFATETKAGIAKLKNSITAKAEDTAVTEKAVADAIEAIKTDKAGSINKGTTGYAKLENGLIFQWGRTSAPDREDKFYIYFPITFPSTCLNVLMTLEAGVDWNFYDCVLQIYSKSSSSATCICGVWGGGEIKSGADVHWLAIGY